MIMYLIDETRRLYRIPPFRDAHMHFLRCGKTMPRGELPAVMDAYVNSGIFHVRDMGHKSMPGLKAKGLLSPRLKVETAVAVIHRKGGYGSFLGCGIEGAGQIPAVVKGLADAGADFIKVINSGVVDIRGEGITEGGFSPDELRLLCREAAGRGLEVSCHANGDDAIRSALEAGVSSIEHGFLASKETLRIMADRGVAWTPTVYALLSLGGPLPEEQRRYVEEVVSRHLESISYAASKGVRLQVGTDSGSASVEHGSSYIGELRLFRKAGLSLEQIIASACMDDREIARGNYLIVKEDFIETGLIEKIGAPEQPLGD